MVYAIVELPTVLLGVYVWLLPLLGRIKNLEYRMQNYELSEECSIMNYNY